ncbi:Ribosomal RNA small subunit methyltransferase I [Saezia sanguinis]|uniref:Ribosomal RNA small subunit methyltransferase I n=1 Tax=Saezia sanguinis TaxID=1965230 RepID=A0A433SGT7_9BURK|nr:SAM-dependent methyltransferase [Saezia sanguinis]RUS67963.1 Ribosomal RNA small subunit methyltransferase I [Saezia sanguinis]
MADQNTATDTGVLWLVPAPLDFGTDSPIALDAIIPRDVIAQAAQITHWVVENAKTARAVLKRVNEISPLALPLQQMHMTELPRQVHKQGDAGFDARALMQPALQGNDIGLMSEAGLPAVADPGSSVVRAAHALHIPVRPLVGPSSILLALMGSGMNGQSFAFVGYLPVQADERARRISDLEKLALRFGQTQLFIETPYRNEAMMQTLLAALAPDTQLAVAAGVTLPGGWQHSMKVSAWKQEAQNGWKKLRLSAEQWKLPAVFAIGK